MLESLRKNSRSLLIVVLFGVLIAAFVISLNPTHVSGCGGLGGKEEVDEGPVVTVEKQTVSPEEFNWLYEMWVSHHERAVQFLQPSGAKQGVMDLVIERTLWAEQAKKLGLFVSEKEVVDQLIQGNILLLGSSISIKPYVFQGDVLQTERLEKWMHKYGWTVRDFVEGQRTEWLAHRAKLWMRNSVPMGEDEARQWYGDQERKANVAYVEFSFAAISDRLAPSEKEVEDFAMKHTAELEKRYNARKAFEFTKQPRKVHLQHIVKSIPKDAKEELVTQAQGVLESAEKAMVAGNRFADIARTLSDDQSTKEKGGWMEWRAQGQTGFGEAIEKKIFAAKPGTLLKIERTENGLELIRVDAFREGDISFQEVKSELAEQLYRDETSKRMAREAAQEAVEKIKAGSKLENLFARPENDSKTVVPKGRPEVQETGLVASRGEELGPLTSKSLVQQVFSKPIGELIGPLETSAAVLLAVVKERKEPDWKEFEKDRAKLIEGYRLLKASHVVKQWAVQQCSQAKASRSVEVNQKVFMENNTQAQPPYEACLGRFGTLMSLVTGEK